jgi:hypothetical protein
LHSKELQPRAQTEIEQWDSFSLERHHLNGDQKKKKKVDDKYDTVQNGRNQ